MRMMASSSAITTRIVTGTSFRRSGAPGRAHSTASHRRTAPAVAPTSRPGQAVEELVLAHLELGDLGHHALAVLAHRVDVLAGLVGLLRRRRGLRHEGP